MPVRQYARRTGCPKLARSPSLRDTELSQQIAYYAPVFGVHPTIYTVRSAFDPWTERPMVTSARVRGFWAQIWAIPSAQKTRRLVCTLG